MCGNCLLRETAYICPMQCPKGLRNGPCGSGAVEGCCVDPTRPCVWHLIYERAEAQGKLDRLLEVEAPLDWSRVGRETWGTVAAEARSRGLLSPTYLSRTDDWRMQMQLLFQDIRQPEWWQGDDLYHPATSQQPASGLQASLAGGEFAVTAEISPPASADADKFRSNAGRLRDMIHASNVTQNPMATPRMSSVACSALLLEEGIEPVLQLTARDYNRFALQSEALGASALGIHNILCLTGDPPTNNPGPASGLPFDLDATQMLWILRRMRDEHRFLDGREIESPPKLFLGAAASPSGPNLLHETLRLKKKINAGAQFIQTQLVYDIDALCRWLEALDKSDLLRKTHILVGIGPLRSAKVARYIQEHIPDIVVPQTFINALERSSNPDETGFEFALELIRKLTVLPGVSGVHIMTMGWEEILGRLVREAELPAFQRR